MPLFQRSSVFTPTVGTTALRSSAALLQRIRLTSSNVAFLFNFVAYR
jgi:hypothetical protein